MCIFPRPPLPLPPPFLAPSLFWGICADPACIWYYWLLFLLLVFCVQKGTKVFKKSCLLEIMIKTKTKKSLFFCQNVDKNVLCLFFFILYCFPNLNLTLNKDVWRVVNWPDGWTHWAQVMWPHFHIHIGYANI